MRIDLEKLKRYFRSLQQKGISTAEMKQKLNSVDNFVNWANKKGLLNEDKYKQLNQGIAEIRKKISSIFYRIAPATWKNRLKKEVGKWVKMPVWKSKTESVSQSTDSVKVRIGGKPWFHKSPSEFDIRHYIGISIILVIMAALGAGAYNQFFKEATTPFAFPVNLTKGGRVLSFQGRLTDSLGNPISTATNLKFKLYNASTAGTTLYDSAACSITPDSDGVFDVLIGGSSYSPTPPQEVCGTEITQNIFSDWPNVYLGVTIGADAEATPRQQIANVGYAINAETLQGFPPGSGFSNIPYINSDGNIIIATSAAGIRNSWASTNFTLSSSGIITVQSAGTGDVALTATESGNITATTGLGTTLFNVLTGNLKVGNGTPGVTQDGEDAYIEGTLEVDGATTLDGALTANGNITVSSAQILGGSPLVFEGTTDNNITTTFAITDPTVSNKTITFTNETGTVCLNTGNCAESGIGADILDFTEFEDTLDLDANLQLNQTTYTWAQDFTGTTTTGYTYSANSLTTGTAMSLGSTSTAGGASGSSKVLNIARSGANAQLAHTAYGIYSAVTNTNVTSGTNIAGYFSASGATTANYGLIVNAGNVGIGTTAPGTNLDVRGSSAGARLDALQVYNTNTTAGSLAGIGLGSNEGDGLRQRAVLVGGYDTTLANSGYLAVYTRNAGTTAEKLRVTKEGNVGIGDTSPAANLVVGSDATITYANGAGDVYVQNDLEVDGTIYGAVSGDLTCTDCIDFIDFEDTLDLDANLTLNQTTYTWTQDFTGTTTTGYTYSANSLTTGTAYSLGSTSTAGGASGTSKVLNIARSGANAQLAHTAYGIYSAVTNTNVTSGTNIAGYFSASGATTANYGLIVENGNVGIGTTAPTAGYKLHVQDGDFLLRNAEAGTSIVVDNTSTGDPLLSFDLNGTRKFTLGVDNSDSDKFKIGSGSSLGTGSEFTIQSDGNVGIGTTSPGSLLDIQGSAAELRVRDTGTTQAVIRFYDTTTDEIAAVKGLSADSSLALEANGTEVMRLVSGNVGIGTTGPGALLEVEGSGGILVDHTGVSDVGLTIQQASSGRAQIVLENSTGTDIWRYGITGAGGTGFAFYDQTQNVLTMEQNGDVYFTPAGNVGIGTTGPTEKLVVNNGNIITSGEGINLTNFGAYLHQDFNDGSLPSDFTLIQITATYPEPGSIIQLESTGTDPKLSWTGLSIDGGVYRYIVFKLRYVSGSTAWQGTTYYSTTGGASPHGESESYKQTYSAPPSDGSWRIYVLDMWNLAAGGTDWKDNTITSIRNDWANALGGIYELDWIAIGSDSPSPLVNIYEKSGSVGIGDTTPAALFTVGSGDLFQVNSSGLAFLPNGSSSAPSLSFTGDTDTGFYKYGTDEIGVTAGSTARFSIPGGATNPTIFQSRVNSTSGSQLRLGNSYAPTIGARQSGADAFFTSNAYQTTIGSDAWDKESATYSSNLIRLGISTGNNGIAFQVKHSPANTVTGTFANFYTTDLLTVTESGKVGVGITAPVPLLHVYENTSTDSSSASVGQTIEQNGTGDAVLAFLLTGLRRWQVGVDNSDSDKFKIGPNLDAFTTYPALTIDTSSNVGIGTTSPGAKLHVSGGASASQIMAYGDANTNAELYLAETNSLVGAMVRYEGAANRFDILTSSGSSWTGKEKLSILRDSGNVGIGNTSPVGKLDVSGAVTGKALVIFNETGDQNILTASASGTTRFVVQNGGNVGIGDTTPAATLTVGDGDLFQVAGATGNITTAGDIAVNGGDITTSASAFNLINATATTVNIAGAATTLNVGASTGTTTVNNALTVTGAGTFSSTLGVTGNTTLTGDLAVNGGDITSTGALTLTPGAGTNFNIALSTTGDFAVNTNQLYMDTSTGYVGIGTTAPSSRLEVNGGIEITNLYNNSTGTFFNGGCSDNQYISSISSAGTISCGWDSGNGIGDITGVTAGTNMSGGGSSGSVTLNMLATTTGNGDSALCYSTAGSTVRYETDRACTASLRVFKDNITDLNVGLEELLALRPVEFDWNRHYYGDAYDEIGKHELHDFGFVAEEVDQVNPLIADYTNDGQLESVRYLQITALLTKALQQVVGVVDVSGAVGLNNPSIKINGTGNVGIGTQTPNYDLEVAGDIAANSFVNISTRNSKKNISYLSSVDTENFLNKIKNLKIAKYDYKTDSGNSANRLGLIAEDSPSEILATGGKGVDLYKLTTLAIGGIQAQQKDLEDIKEKVERGTYNVEQITKTIKALVNEIANIKDSIASITSNVSSLQNDIIALQKKTDSLIDGAVEQISSTIGSFTNLSVSNKFISPIVETEEIQSKSQNLKVKSTNQNSKVSIVNKDDQPTVEFDTENKKTSIFGSLEIKNDQEKGKLAKLIIKGINDNKVAEFDAEGNVRLQGDLSARHATLSGTLTSGKIETSEASISGKLTAKEVQADNINQLASRTSAVEERSGKTAEVSEELTTDINEIQTFLADLKNQPVSNVANYQDAETMNNLSVTGDTSLYRVFVSNTLTAGNILFEDNKIMSLDFELKLTALSSINLLDGQVIISKTGGLTTKGPITALAGIKTNKIEPLNSNENVFVKNLQTNKIQISDKYLDATTSASIITASDNFNENGIYSPAIKTDAQSAGIAIIKKQDEDLIIYNDSIKKDSLIYLTPTVNTGGNSLSVVEKEACSSKTSEVDQGTSEVKCTPYFKVSTSGQRTNEVKFNWLIIN